MKTALKICLLPCIIGITLCANNASANHIEGITFAANPGRIYLPIEEAANLLEWKLEQDTATKKITLNGKNLDYWSLRRLIGGVTLVSESNLVTAGAEVTKDSETGLVTLSTGTKQIVLSPGAKRVFVDLQAQQMKAWEGERLVLDCHISSGRYGNTPAGNFQTGPFKAR